MPPSRRREVEMSERAVLKDAARSLREHLFGPHFGLSDGGFVGIGADHIQIYVHARKRQWRGPIMDTWQGWPVTWRYGVGPIVAFGGFPDA